jgi:recombinational DNA repair protein (RecF pathway)
MHLLHTTPAFVLQSYPHGESSRVYKLFTRERGLLYAHAQGVRELRNRNRFALQIAAHLSVTLVRGREVWRVTGAGAADGGGAASARLPAARRMLALAGRLLPVEDPAPALFDALARGFAALSAAPADDARRVETVTVLRVLNLLGYVARPVEDELLAAVLAEPAFPDDLMARVCAAERMLVAQANSALQGARA